MANGISSRSISRDSVPSVEHLFKGGERSDRLIISSIQALIAVGVVLVFIMGLSKFKEFYAARKLHL